MTILNLSGLGGSGMPATSGTWTFSVTRDDLIRQAMLNLGLLEPSEVPTAQETIDCARVLNMIVKTRAGNLDKSPGFKMFQRKRGDLFLGNSKSVYNLGSPLGDNWVDSTTGLVYPQSYGQDQLIATAAAGQKVLTLGVGSTAQNIGDFLGVVIGSDIFWSTVASVQAGAGTITLADNLPTPGALANAYVWNYTVKAQRPMIIKTVLLRDINGTDTPITILDLEQYESLPTKQQPGFTQDPTAIYYEAQMQNNLGVLYLDCVGAQDVTKHLHVVFLRESMDFNNPGDAPEYPQEWFLDLSWELSLQICGMFDADWTPDRQAAYAVAVTRASEGVPETDSKFFQPDDPDSGY